MTWTRLLVKMALPVLLAVTSQGQNQPSPTPEKTYSITGKVNRPGLYPLTQPTTVLDAIKSAGGFSGSDPVDIQVARGNTAFLFHYSEVGNAKNHNMELQSDDVVTVKPAPLKLDQIRLPPPP